MKIKVMLVDDHKIIRDGISSILDTVDDIQIVAEVGDGKEAIVKANETFPDVVVMDLILPNLGGIPTCKRILANNPGTKVLILSMIIDENCVLESLEAGARGYLAKNCAAEELVTAVRTVNQGNPYFSALALEIIISKYSSGTPMGRTDSNLTKREREVLRLTALGECPKEISFSLGVSVKTIEVNRMNIKRKLGLKSIAELTTYALKIGLITTESISIHACKETSAAFLDK